VTELIHGSAETVGPPRHRSEILDQAILRRDYLWFALLESSVTRHRGLRRDRGTRLLWRSRLAHQPRYSQHHLGSSWYRSGDAERQNCRWSTCS